MLGAAQVPCGPQPAVPQTGVVQSEPLQPDAQVQVFGAEHRPLAPPHPWGHTGTLHIVAGGVAAAAASRANGLPPGPQPESQVQVFGAVHFPWGPQDTSQVGTLHFPGGPMPLAQAEQSLVAKPAWQVHLPVPAVVPLPSHVPCPEPE